MQSDRKNQPSRDVSRPRLSNNRDFSIELASAFASEMSDPSGNHRNTVLASTPIARAIFRYVGVSPLTTI